MLWQSMIQHYGNKVGFLSLGVMKARLFSELEPMLQQRRQERRVTAFEEQDIEKRLDPFRLMADVKSILVTATSCHFSEREPQEPAEGCWGELAKFARGPDYHLVVHQQLHRLAEALQAQCEDLRWQAYVDTGPLVDRYLAAQAGLGFYGRNNCFILPGHGSHAVFGYLLINREVEGSNHQVLPLKSCEECGRCQRACPTRALETPFQVDPDRCLSHLLQRREQIPESVRGIIGRKMYGCDICQDVCPHNQKNRACEARPDLEDPGRWIDLAELLGLSNRAFNRRYRKSAFGWRGQKIIQRNALLVLGNTPDFRTRKLIGPFLEHPRHELREMAQWADRQHQMHR